MSYDQDEYQEQCYHISEYQPRGSMMGHGDEVGWVEPDSFMETVKRLLSESGSDTKYLISCPVDNEDDGFGDTVVWKRGDRVHLVEEYYAEYQWSVGLSELTLSSFWSPRYRNDPSFVQGVGGGGGE